MNLEDFKCLGNIEIDGHKGVLYERPYAVAYEEEWNSYIEGDEGIFIREDGLAALAERDFEWNWYLYLEEGKPYETWEQCLKVNLINDIECHLWNMGWFLPKRKPKLCNGKWSIELKEDDDLWKDRYYLVNNDFVPVNDFVPYMIKLEVGDLLGYLPPDQEERDKIYSLKKALL